MTDENTTDDTTDQPGGANQLVRRGFDGITLAHEGPATQALIAKETATIQARWIMALKRPRLMDEVRQKLIQECKRVGFAEKAIYNVPRGDKSIRGLTIRFAEVAMRCMTNMSAEAVTIFDSDEERLVRVTATDYESNTTWMRDITVKKTVERKFLKKGQQAIRARTNSYGEPVYIIEATDDDVTTKEGAMISKTSRTAILRLIPGDLRDEMFRLCDTLMADKARKDPDGEKKRVLDAFAGLNIMPNKLEEWLGHGLDQLTPAEVAELSKLYRALREGEIDWADAMEGAEETRARAKAEAKVAAAAAAKARAEAPKTGNPPASSNGNGQKTEPPASTTTAKPADAPKTEPAAKTEPARTVSIAVMPGAHGSPKTDAKHDDKKIASSSGKGTAAVKDKMSKSEEPKPAPAAAQSTPPPPGKEERDCSICGVPIDVPIEVPVGTQRCYSCKDEVKDGEKPGESQD